VWRFGVARRIQAPVADRVGAFGGEGEAGAGLLGFPFFFAKKKYSRTCFNAVKIVY
jgi:hypothetical protein